VREVAGSLLNIPLEPPVEPNYISSVESLVLDLGRMPTVTGVSVSTHQLSGLASLGNKGGTAGFKSRPFYRTRFFYIYNSSNYI
jgi:hypothetical protein